MEEDLVRKKKAKIGHSDLTFTANNKARPPPLKELAEKYASKIGILNSKAEVVPERIRYVAFQRRINHLIFTETGVANLKIILPKALGKEKRHLKTKLGVTALDLTKRISEEFGLGKFIELIVEHKKLIPDISLDQQNPAVKDNAAIMVLRLTEPEKIKRMVEEEQKKRTQEESVAMTEKGFQILSDRDESDKGTLLGIADQKGNPLTIQTNKKKALILAMGFHEKGRTLMKKKMYEEALDYLLRADQQFKKCDSALWNSVDNYAVLQLDIVWCYRAVQALTSIDEGKRRLEEVDKLFLSCFGKEKERLEAIKGNTILEEGLFLRMYLLQSLLAFLGNNMKHAEQKLAKAEELYHQLLLDDNTLHDLMKRKECTAQEARLALRACRGDVDEAIQHISRRREEAETRRRHLMAINTLEELGYSRKDAAEAFHKSGQDLNKAYKILLDTYRPNDAANFTEPSAASGSPAEDQMGIDLVNKVLEDLPRHEEDYLDFTLEEEREFIAEMKSLFQSNN